MPVLFIHTADAEFHSRDDGAEYDRPEAALAQGIRGAVALIADEVSRGGRSVAVEVSVEQADGTQLLRSVVALCVSPLILSAQSLTPEVGYQDGDAVDA